MTVPEPFFQTSAGGGADAPRRLYQLLYADLKKLAQDRMRRSGSLGALNTTALVHESFLRLQGAQALDFPDKQHFMAYAARTMRSVVVDLVRHRLTERNGGGAHHVPLDTGACEEAAAVQLREGLNHDAQLLRVHEALDELAQVEPRLATVVELRYFVGLTEAEVASALDVTVRTVQRDWTKARLFLGAALQ